VFFSNVSDYLGGEKKLTGNSLVVVCW